MVLVLLQESNLFVSEYNRQHCFSGTGYQQSILNSLLLDFFRLLSVLQSVNSSSAVTSKDNLDELVSHKKNLLISFSINVRNPIWHLNRSIQGAGIPTVLQ